MKFLPLFYRLGLSLLLGACASINPPPPTKTETTQDPGLFNPSADHSQLAKSDPPSLQGLMQEISRSQAIPLDFLENGFKDSKHLSQVKKLVAPPPVTFQKNWQVYKNRFIEPTRIKAGLAFIAQNRNALEAAEAKTGVPHQVIAAIIGIETLYGRQMGNFRVKDALSTLAFDYPEAPNKAVRENLFRNQLKDLILMCWLEANQRQDAFNRCLNQTSSYAGAIGLPQFMPGSILQFAIDGDGDGVVDLRHSRSDAVFSVANFLVAHGWQAAMPIYFPTVLDKQTHPKIIELADGQPILKHSVAEFIQLGILDPIYGDPLKGGVAPSSKALIVDLPSPSKNQEPDVEYVIGLENFLSIVNYNRSYFYAQSVAEFAQALGYRNQNTLMSDQSTTKNSLEQAKSKKKGVKPKETKRVSKPNN